MPYNVMVRVRGRTEWVICGIALSKEEADRLAVEVSHRVQIVTFPTGKDLRSIEELISDPKSIIFPYGGTLDYDFRRINKSGETSREDPRKD